jgi:hypothetical protein
MTVAIPHPYEPDWEVHEKTGYGTVDWAVYQPEGATDLPPCATCGGSLAGAQHAVPGEPPRDYWAERRRQQNLWIPQRP